MKSAPAAAGLVPDLDAILAAHGRLPRLDDSPAPWHFRGWLLPHVIDLDAASGTG